MAVRSLLRHVVRRHRGPAAPPAGLAGPAASEIPDVVIVDDSAGVRNILSQTVGKAGLTCAAASSLEEVERLNLDRGTSLIILDLSLERSDAVDVLRHLSQHAFAGQIVPITGQDAAVLDYVGTLGRQQGLRMLPGLQKPFRTDAIRFLLAEHAHRHAEATSIDFKQVLERGQLEVWYQPRVELGSYMIVGFESLVRIRHPQQGLLMPGQFMAQLSDLDMADLTDHVLRRTLATWERLARIGFVLKASMNVRVREMLSPNLIEVLKAARPKDPRWSGLVMELTEPELLDEVETAREAVVRLQLHKVQLALDDFGSVVGGLVRCPELKLSEVGVDRRFVTGCAADPERLAICKAAVAFASRARIRAVAEGIETLADRAAVRKLGFDWAQGNLFSAAVPYETFEAMLRKREPIGPSSSVGNAA